jgi:aspartyl-tRNA(Asn)/glutamyl-tRNA(Gln) amidotransferase subunit A
LALSASDVIDADKARVATMGALQGMLSSYDVIVSPQMPVTALPLEQDLVETWVPGQRMDHWVDWCPFTYPLNLTRHPAASVPVGFDGAGLPVALQVVGRHYEDRLLLRVARAIERERPFPMPDPASLTA